MINNVNLSLQISIILSFVLISIVVFSSFVPFSKAQAQPPSPKIISCKPVPQLSLVSKPDPKQAKSFASSLTNITQQVRKKLLEYEKSPTGQLRQDLQKLIDERKKIFVETIRENPDIAISFILAPEELSQLNKISTNCVENFVTLTGKLQVQVANLKDHTALYRYDLITNDSKRIITVHPALGLKVPLRSGTEVRVSGFQIDNDILFNGSSSLKSFTSVSGLEVLKQPSILATQGPQRTLVLLLNFNNTSAPTITTTQLQNIIFNNNNSVNVFYTANSYGNIFLSGTVLGRFDLNVKACAPNDADLNAAIAAADPQVDFTNFVHLVLVAPYGSCLRGVGDIGPWRTIQTADSNMPIPMTLARADSGGFSLQTVITHELGHNFNSGHAHSVDCGGNTISLNFPSYNDCTFGEYGDLFDIMGLDWNSGHFNAPHMENYGWLVPPNIQTVTYTGEPSKRFTIEPIETIPPNDNQPHLKALKLARGGGDFLYIEYRQPIFPDNQANFQSFTDVFQGATMHILNTDNGYSGSDPYLIDASPDAIEPDNVVTPFGNDRDRYVMGQSVLKVGNSFFDPGSGTSISVVSANSNGLTVDINFFPVSIIIGGYKFERGWGSQGIGEGRFSGPGGVATDPNGNVYVADGNRIQKFNSNGVFLGWLGKCTSGPNTKCDSINQRSIGFSCDNSCGGLGVGSGNGQFNAANDLAIDSNGNIFVLEFLNRRIQEFTSNGAFVLSWGSQDNSIDPNPSAHDGKFVSPSGIAVQSQSRIVFVTDSLGSAGHEVQQFLLANPCPAGLTQLSPGVCYLRGWSVTTCQLGSTDIVLPCNKDDTGRVTGNGQFGFNGPEGIAVDNSGNVFIADPSNERIEKFSSNGRFITKWGFFSSPSIGLKNGGFGLGDHPRLAIDSSGSVYVVDSGLDTFNSNSRVQKFTTDGLFITKWGSYCDISSISSSNPDGCNLSVPGALDLGDGQFSTNPYGIVVSSSGRVYVADIDNHRIQAFVRGLLPLP